MKNIPLKHVHHNIKGRNEILEVELKLIYENIFESNLLEANFNFSLKST